MATKVLIGALAILILAQQIRDHAHDLCAFFVDGQGVEVINIHKALGAHRVRLQVRYVPSLLVQMRVFRH